jgi:hypothetical protein
MRVRTETEAAAPSAHGLLTEAGSVLRLSHSDAFRVTCLPRLRCLKPQAVTFVT